MNFSNLKIYLLLLKGAEPCCEILAYTPLLHLLFDDISVPKRVGVNILLKWCGINLSVFRLVYAAYIG
jgi:hypothetical protein